MRMSSAVRRRWKASRGVCEASRGVIAVLLAIGATGMPGHALAQFAGTPSVVAGGATFSTSGATQTITLGGTSGQTIINWAPSDTATSTAPISFLPFGQNVFFASPTFFNTPPPVSVLNRILPTDATRAIELNGGVSSSPNVRVWFYSPGGFLIGPKATFNLGGLVLTAADPVLSTDANGNPIFITSTAGTDTFSVAGAAGSQSAITIESGAQITVNGITGHSTYMVAIAPQINNAGTINVAGSTALIAAESASFAVDPSGLFHVSVSAGSTVSNNTFINTGTVGSTDSVADGAAQVRRVYLVAVPKNNAITMAISSGGTVGFATAGAASMEGNEVVLSAGENIADTGTGSPTVVANAGSGAASLTIGAGTYSSNTFAASTGSVTVTDPASSITFGSNLALTAPQAAVIAATGTIAVGGNLSVIADNLGLGNSAIGNLASVSVANGAKLTVGGAAAALVVNGDLTVSANDTLGGNGGIAQVAVTGGSLTVAGLATVSATGSWANAGEDSNPGGIATSGGTASVTASASGTITVGEVLSVDASADGSAAASAYANVGSPPPDTGINATGGHATIMATGSGSLINAAGGLLANSDAIGGTDTTVTTGGSAIGGVVSLSAASGGTLQTGNAGQILGSAIATGGTSSTGNGGFALGGSVSLSASNGTVTMTGPAAITLAASASGGSSSLASGFATGGEATGGTVSLGVSGATGTIVTNTTGQAPGSYGAILDTSAVGGISSETGAGGAATGGTTTIDVAGPGTVSLLGIPSLTVLASAQGGSGGANGSGGLATGGNVNLDITSGIFTTSAAAQFTALAAGGGNASGNGGDAVGGNVQVNVTNGGTLTIDAGTVFSASAQGGTSSPDTGGNALGGNVLVNTTNSYPLQFAAVSGGLTFDTSYTAGPGDTSGTAASAGGARFASDASLTIGSTVSMVGNTSLVIKSGGSIDLTGTIFAPGNNAHLQLWADDTGTGTGTVTLNGLDIYMSGTNPTVDIDYNPTALGTPTNYAPNVSGAVPVAYQLIDNVMQLQEIGSYLSQNFALGRNIDASATAGWNGGAGFVPISPFSGNFDGLNHTITNLTINHGTNDDTGLFGELGANLGSNIIVRNLGLINEIVTGANYVGGLAGFVGTDNVTISNVYSTGSTITGQQYIGGLIGVTTSTSYNISLTGVHFNGTVTASLSDAGGLIGQDGTATIANSFSTGSVSGVSDVGGLIGLANAGGISQVYSTANVSTPASGSTLGTYLGGLVGNVISAAVTISGAYATGSVTAGTGSTGVGALVGRNLGPITNSWASGAVSAPSGSGVGGFVGVNASAITNSYWDEYSTGQSIGVGTDSGTTALNPVSSNAAQIAAGAPSAFLAGSYTNLTSGAWVYDGAITRPIGQWEVPVAQYLVATVNSAHQVQLFDQNAAGSYLVTQNIDMSGTSQLSDIWGGTGLIPITYESSGLFNGITRPFTGAIAGGGHVLSNLVLNTSVNEVTGLVAENAGQITDLGLSNATLFSPNGNVAVGGLLVGQNDATGSIFDSFATGSVSAVEATAGGLVGNNYGSISQSYATVAVGGNAMLAGGLIGANSGTVSQVYANGMVSGSVAGGLIGSDSSSPGSITNAYWDMQFSGQALGCSNTCSGVTGLTTAASLLSGSYGGFSIDTIGGQGLPWRMYQVDTTPLLEAFLIPITVQPLSLTTTYNATVPNIGVTTYGAAPTLVFGTATLSGLSQNAGTYSVNYAGGLSSIQTGYDLVPSTKPGTLVINPAALTLAAVTDAKTYDSTTNSQGQVQVTGLQGQDNVSSLFQSFDSPNAGARVLSVNNGYVINDGNNGNNYTVTLLTAAGTITPAPLTLAAVTDSRTYNATTASAGAVQVYGLYGSDSVTSLAQSFDSANAGTRTLSVNPGYVVNDGNSGGNYTVTTVTAPGSITPATLTLSAASDSRTYNATTSSTGTVQVSGLFGSDSVVNLSQSFDSPNAGSRTLSVNTGYVVQDGNNGGNYTVNTVSAGGSITPAALTLSAVSQTRTYDSTTNSTGTVQVSGLIGSDTVTNLTQSFDSPNAGARTLSVNGGYTINDGNDGGNYTVTSLSASGTITPAPLTLAATSQTRVYDTTTNSTGTVQVTGLFGSDSVTGLTQSYDSPNAGARLLSVNSGFSINDGNDGGNYTVTLQSATGSITPAPLTLVAASQTRSYNATTNSTALIEIIGLQGTDSIGNLSESFDSANVGQRVLSVNPGYQINDGNNGGNYTVTSQTASGSITPATLTLTATSQTRTYNATTASSGAVIVTGLFGSDTVTSLAQSFDSANAGARTLSVNAGYVVNDGNAGSNYVVNTQSAAGTITPAPLTLSAVSQTRIYDATTGSSGVVQVTGLFGSDSVSNLTQSYDSANAGARLLSVNGGYTINDGNSGGNYTVTLQSATGSITPAPLTLIAASQTRTYNATTASNGTVQVYGLLGNDSISNLTQSFDSANAGARTLSVTPGYTLQDGNNGGNYTVTVQSASGTITPAPLTLTAVSQTRTYDATTASSGTVLVNGLFGSDSVTGLSQSFDSPNAGARTLNVKPGYAVNDGNDGGNYTVSLQSAAGTITPAPLIVTYTAQAVSNVYGDPIPTLSGSVTVQGLQGSDTKSTVLTDSATQFTTAATAQTGVGSYGVTGSGLALASANYTATFDQAPGNASALTITQRPIDIIAQPVTRPFGESNPPLTYTVTGATSAASSAPGLVNGDQLTGSLATTATTTSPAGSYPITQGTLAASPNYSVTFTGADLTVQGGPNTTGTGNPVTMTVSSIDTSLPGPPGDNGGGGGDNGGGFGGGGFGDGGFGGGSTDPQRPGVHAKIIAAVRGAVLPTWVPSNVFDERIINRPRDVTEPVSINGDPSSWTSGGANR